MAEPATSPAPITPAPLDAARRRRMGATAAIAAAAACGMLGLAFAAPPLYDAFCRITGFGGTTQVAAAERAAPVAREITVRFDSNVAPGAAIAFTPLERARTLRLGETAMAYYRVANVSDAPQTVIATYNVAPHKTGLYFRKIECFCFQTRTLAPGETLELPVVFYVDPELALDPDTEEVGEITLSYTYFRAAGAAAARTAAVGLGAAPTAR